MTGARNSQRRELFVEVSKELTGFSRVELLGTGMSTIYLDTFEEILSPDMVDEFLALHAERSTTAGGSATSTVLGDEKWGPVARNLIILWYSGMWDELPGDWRAAHGAAATDTTHVISPRAYEAGLQWLAAGAHPAGARQQGFGAWAVAPAAH